MLRGLGVYAGGSLICLAASLPALAGLSGYLVLLVGRLLIGLGESQTLVGMMGWGIGFMGSARSGRVLAMVGAGLYGAFAVGGPVGRALFRAIGFPGLMLVCTVLPLVGMAVLARIPGVAPHPGNRDSFWRVLGRIWREGGVVGLQGVGFAGLGAFISLYFLSRHWSYAGVGLTAFGAGFVLMRLMFGHLPDRIGGRKVAAVSLVVEAAGQYLLWLAPNPGLALLGALLTGLGCSMVFPAMGMEVVRRVPPQLRATAVGGFAAFQDLAYGATGPVAGIVADHAGYAEVFLIGGVAATLGLVLALVARSAPAAS
jgi:predicted MFS family arabinose efflux permease